MKQQFIEGQIEPQISVSGDRSEDNSCKLKSAGLVLVGDPRTTHVGRHLWVAARELSIPTHFCDCERAYRANPLVSKLNWWFRSHRPTHLSEFSRYASGTCIQSGAGCLITTGLAPIDACTLDSLGKAGVVRMNFLTDDPWNPHHQAAWFMSALPHYDVVFNPRRANVEELRRIGCRDVRYLPFAYAPDIHFPDPPGTPEEKIRFDADVFFAGGADADRVPYVSALVRAKMKVALYGSYWGRSSEFRSFEHGHANHETLRKAASGSRIALCLVRRANRDGHVMRTYELAASGACILAEDTEEHHEILGNDGACVVYFRSVSEMVEKAKALLNDSSKRNRLAAAARVHIHGGPNTYKHRLIEMLRVTRKTAKQDSGISVKNVARMSANS